jgi:SP family general alpha glucoside:H+ symporter-like MFS transporter
MSEKNDITAVAPDMVATQEKKETSVHNDTSHLEDLPVDAIANGKWEDLRADAMVAEEAERSLTLRESFRLYPKAVMWSLGISLCIVMEGYDLGSESVLSLSMSHALTLPVLGNLVGVNEYRKKYGYWTGEQNGYQLTPAWQSAIGLASTIGCFL